VGRSRIHALRGSGRLHSMKSILLCLSVLVAFQAVAQPTKPEGRAVRRRPRRPGRQERLPTRSRRRDQSGRSRRSPSEGDAGEVPQKDVEKKLSKTRQRQIKPTCASHPSPENPSTRRRPTCSSASRRRSGRRPSTATSWSRKEYDKLYEAYRIKGLAQEECPTSRRRTTARRIDEYKALLKEFPNYEPHRRGDVLPRPRPASRRTRRRTARATCSA
jgi:hypothetical protein